MKEGIGGEIERLSCVNFSADVPASIWSAFIKITEASLVPEQIYGDDRPAEESDFVHFKSDVTRNLDALLKFIDTFVAAASGRPFNRDALISTLVLCGEHSSVELWTSKSSCRFSVLCLKALCTLHGCSSPSQLLLGLCDKVKSPCLKQALLLLRPKLLKETWRRHPGAVLTYKWLLLHVNSPYLSAYIEVVSPTALLLLDDHDESRRLVGLHCLSHIMNNVTRTDMCQRGLEQVFYQTLEPLLWQQKANQVGPIIMCLTRLLSVTERGYTRRTDPGMWDLFDNTLSTLIDRMVFEDQIPLRKAYIKSLGPLLSEMGPSVIRWSKPLLTVFDEYMCKESFDTRKYALEALYIYIELTTPRLEQNGDAILFLLLRTLTDLSHEMESLKQDSNADLIGILREMIILVAKVCPNHFIRVASDLACLQVNYRTVTTILNECSKQIIN